MRTRPLLITLLTTVMLPICWAQSPSTPAATEKAPPAANDTAESKPSITKSKDTLSVDFPDEEIRNVLRNVADLFELNIVIPDTLQGKTSIKLRDVTWRQIFQVILAPVGYTFVEDGNIIKIVTQESLNLEPLTTEVFVLNYAKASEVKPSIDALIDPKVGAKIVVDTRTNALVVTERPSAIQKIRPIVSNLDHATEQVMIETKFIEVTDTDVKNIGVNWASLSGYKVGTTGPLTRQYTNTQGRTNTNSHIENNLDVPFVDSGLAKETQIYNNNGYPGLNIGPTLTKNADGSFSADPSYNASSQLANLFTNNVSRVTSALFSADQFQLIVGALASLHNTKLVSNPTVVTLNNSEASINIGEEYPIPSYTYNQERGSFEVSGFTYKPIGVILKVTPQVNAAGFIKLTVAPEVSTRNGTVNFGGAGGAALPIIGVRKTTTEVTIKDGFTLGIGGLVESSHFKDESKVPVLGSIPGLGRLFRSNDSDKTNHNLIVFLTARTLRPDGASVGEVFDPRIIRQMGLTKDELPGYRDGSDPFYQPPPEPKKK